MSKRNRRIWTFETKCQLSKKALSLALAFAAYSVSAEAGAIRTPVECDPVEDSYMVVLQPTGRAGNVRAAAEQLTDKLGAKLGFVYEHALRGFSVSSSRESAEALAGEPSVDFVEQNCRVFLETTQTNPPWGLDRIDQSDLPIDQRYNYESTGAGVHVYVIDSGIRATHSEFAGRVGNGAAMVGENTDDCNGHGTHVSGTIGGGTYGVAKGVILHPVRVFPCGGSTPTDVVIRGVDWVTSNHVKPAVANMSLGGSASASLDQAVLNSIASGVTYVVAAANLTQDACRTSPARLGEAITVGATDINDTRAGFSNFGTCVDLFAPGVNVLSAWWTGDSASRSASGTSMASPHVAGVAARLVGQTPGVSPAVVQRMIVQNATAGRLKDIGPGSPNLLLYSVFLDSCTDPIKPRVDITSPMPDQFIWGTFTLEASASDNVGVTRVEFFVDGRRECVDSTPPWRCSVNVDRFPSGRRELKARAFDACGNFRTSAPVPVFFHSNPIPFIDVPAPGATVSGDRVRVKGWATDSDGVASVTVQIDGRAIPAAYGLSRADVCQAVPVGDPGCPNVGYEAFFDSTALSNGNHTVTVTVVDKAGRITSNWPSPPREFRVANARVCQPGVNTLCLLNGRFKVEATYVNNGAYAARALGHSDQSGFFSFFNPENVEIGVKVLGPASGYYWFFHGGLTSLPYTVTVTDTASGAVRTYTKPAGSFCGDADTDAFPAGAQSPMNAPPVFAGSRGPALAAAQLGGSCTPGPTNVCLQNGRFKVEVRRAGALQSGVALSGESGAFWFSGPANIELVVKVLDGTGINGRFWFFYGALSNLGYDVTVTDTLTGAVKTYDNPPGRYCGVGDTNAF